MSKSARILIIDDDESFLKAVGMVLKDLGIVTPVSDARTVISRLGEFDLIICDYQMEFLDGHEVLGLAKKQGLTAPVILVTAFASKDVAIQAANLHVYAILEKPVDIERFRELVTNALSQADLRKSRSSHPAPLLAGIELCARTLSAKCQGEEIPLTDTEFRILSLFIAKKGKRLTREAITSAVWDSCAVAENALDTHLGNLKKKIPILKQLIQVVRGKGYIYGE